MLRYMHTWTCRKLCRLLVPFSTEQTVVANGLSLHIANGFGFGIFESDVFGLSRAYSSRVTVLKKFGFLVGRDTDTLRIRFICWCSKTYIRDQCPVIVESASLVTCFSWPTLLCERVKLVLCYEAAIARASSSRECQCMHLANSYIRHNYSVVYMLWILCATFSWSARKITTTSIRKVHFKLVAVAIILTLCACECECEFCVAYLCLSDLAYRSSAGL